MKSFKYSQMMAILAFVSWTLTSSADELLPREQLKPDLRVTYTANGNLQSPWIINVIRLNQTHKGLSGCTYSEIRYDEVDLQSSWECISDKYLFQYKDNNWLPARPIGSNMRLEERNADGKTVAVFETKDAKEVEIDGVRTKVLKTIVHRFNDDGTIKYRLTEDFSIGLGTATEGVFEAPDKDSESGWRTFTTFKLIKISR